MVARAPQPHAPLLPRFFWDIQLATPLTPDFTGTRDYIEEISKPNGHNVQVAPPLAPFLAANRAGRNKKRKLKKEAKLNKRKDRE
jgi:hypothetical protein